MTINAQSGFGKVELFYDFCAGLDLTDQSSNAYTLSEWTIGDFRVFGDGVSEIDAGIYDPGSDELNGVGRLTTTDETEHATCLGTYLNFDVAKMGPLILEARVQFNNLDTKTSFVGFADTVAADLSFEDDMISGSAGTMTLTASDLCGFYLSAEETDTDDWHAVYNGGTTTGETTSANIDLDCDAVAGEWQILRLEIDPNGTARWYVDGVLKKTLAGAVSTTTDLGVVCGVEAKGAAQEEMDIDYLYVCANRDWNA
jgi:hypothetical protein